MTRFARSKGSKGANERIPDRGTPWPVIKKEAQAVADVDRIRRDREKAEARRKENYHNFLKEEENKKRVDVWCEFDDSPPETHKVDRVKKSKMKMEKKSARAASSEEPDGKRERKTSEFHESDFDEDDPELVEWCRGATADPETEERYEQLESQIETLLAGETSRAVEKPLKKKSKGDGSIVAGESSNVDGEPKLRKKKRKSNPVGEPGDDAETVDGISNTNRSESEIEQKKKRKTAEEKDEKCHTYPVESRSAKTERKIFENRKIDGQIRKRKKPLNTEKTSIIVDGKELEVINYDGFPVLFEDAERLAQLRKSLVSKGIARSEVNRTMKLERRKCEKALSRIKKKMCYHCRKGGHNLSECPELNERDRSALPSSGICFKCGSTEHTHFSCKVVRGQEYKFAKCFICNEQGHISRQCPDNPRGLYPRGGGCRECGDVTHLKKDCPKIVQKKENATIRLETMENDNLEGIDSKLNTDTAVSNRVKHVRF